MKSKFASAVEQAADTGKPVTLHIEGEPKPAAPAAKPAGMIKTFVANMAAAWKPAVNTLFVLRRKFEALIGHPIPPKADLQTLKAADKEHREAWQVKNVRFTPAQARADYLQQLSKMASGESPDPTGWETLLDEYATRSQGAVDRMRKINADALPIVRRTLENFVEAGEFWITDRLTAEKSEAAEFGVTFAPSNVLIAAQRAVSQAKIQLQNLAPGSQANPLAYLQFIEIQ